MSRFSLVVSSLLSLAALTGRARADTTTAYTVDFSSVSSYVWRGTQLSASRLEPTLQPSAELDLVGLGGGTLALNAWSSLSTTGATTGFELDPTVSYLHRVGPLTVVGSYAVYVLKESDPHDAMHEVGALVRRDGATTPFAGVAVDPVRTHGGYVYAGVQHDETVGRTTLRAKVQVGGSRYEMQPAGLQDVTGQLAAIVPLSGGAYVAASGFVAYSGQSEEVYPWLQLSVGVSR